MAASRFAAALSCSSFGDAPGGPVGLPPLEVEPDARAQVTRRELWRVVDAAKAFHRRATTGRLDADHFHRAAEALEAAFEALPEGVWSKT